MKVVVKICTVCEEPHDGSGHPLCEAKYITLHLHGLLSDTHESSIKRMARRTEIKNRKNLTKLKNKAMKFLNILILSIAFISCKKDLPPVPKLNSYRMEIQITDNSPFKNVGSLFAIGNETFIDDQKIGAWTDQEFIYADNHPVYVERILEFTDYDSAAAFLWIGTNLVYDNWYNVKTYRNDTLINQSAGYVLDTKIKIN